MKATIQRVSKASVSIDGGEQKSVGEGLVILLGVGENDSEADADKLADKILNMRIFPNEEGKFDLSLLDLKGDALIVSQFTLYADCGRGRRPDFTKAAKPDKAVPLYNYFVTRIKASGLKVETGEFAADMLVEIHNDGPVTINIDSNEI